MWPWASVRLRTYATSAATTMRAPRTPLPFDEKSPSSRHSRFATDEARLKQPLRWRREACIEVIFLQVKCVMVLLRADNHRNRAMDGWAKWRESCVSGCRAGRDTGRACKAADHASLFWFLSHVAARVSPSALSGGVGAAPNAENATLVSFAPIDYEICNFSRSLWRGNKKRW